MRTQIINVLIAVIFSATSVFAFSTEPSITTDGTKTFVLNNTNWHSTFVDVKITDNSGETIYSGHQDLTTSKRYSLENLKPGNYVITVSNEIKTVENNVTITREAMIVDFNTSTTFKPVFNFSDNNIDLNYLASGVDTKIYIQEDNRVLYQTKIENTASINKRFNVANLPSGNYRIVVSNRNGSFSKNFTK